MIPYQKYRELYNGLCACLPSTRIINTWFYLFPSHTLFLSFLHFKANPPPPRLICYPQTCEYVSICQDQTRTFQTQPYGHYQPTKVSNSSLMLSNIQGTFKFPCLFQKIFFKLVSLKVWTRATHHIWFSHLLSLICSTKFYSLFPWHLFVEETMVFVL